MIWKCGQLSRLSDFGAFLRPWRCKTASAGLFDPGSAGNHAGSAEKKLSAPNKAPSKNYLKQGSIP